MSTQFTQALVLVAWREKSVGPHISPLRRTLHKIVSVNFIKKKINWWMWYYITTESKKSSWNFQISDLFPDFFFFLLKFKFPQTQFQISLTFPLTHGSPG